MENIFNYGVHDQVRLVLVKLKPSNLISCWKNICPKCVKSKDSVIHNNVEFTDIITLARTNGGDEFESANLEELLVDKSLSENEFINLTLEAYHETEHSDNSEENLPVSNVTLIKEGI